VDAVVDLNRSIKTKGKALGFNLVGVCKADYSPENHSYLLNWLNRGFQANLGYLERNPRMRSDPRLFFPGAKSIISVGLSYFTETEYNLSEPYISIYARCRPYQEIIKAKLKELLEYIKTLVPEVRGKIAVDTSPTFDRVWANRAGLGWPGKNTILINKNLGSFIFLGELFVDIEIEPDAPETDHCANCSACLDACPTGALVEPYVLDTSRCVSYLTISTDVEGDGAKLIGNNILGCDICQLACPYNGRIEKSGNRADIRPENDFNNIAKNEYYSLTEPRFKDTFKETIISQKGFYKFRHNALVVQNNISAGKGSN
jgi:epoxyqueuosine reductase